MLVEVPAMRKLLAVLGLLAVAVAARPMIAGASLIVDQQCTSCPTSAGSYLSLPVGNHFGQEFTPTLPAIQWVQLDFDLEPEPASTLTVNIRQGAAGETFAHILAAPILGTGSTVLPAVTTLTSGFFEVDFTSPITLTPGSLYVIDATDSNNTPAFGVVPNDNTSFYSGGRGFSDEGVSGGDPFLVHENPNNGGLIVSFAEGTLGTPPAVPEPASLLLLSTGLTMVAGFVWRRHRP